MGRPQVLFASLLVLAGCQQQPGGNSTASASPIANDAIRVTIATASPDAPPGTGCADRLVFVMNPEPAQLALQEHMPAERLESVRRGTAERFRTVASAMCAGGDLPASAFDAYDRVMITDAEGATEPTLYAGENRTLNYELAFAGDQTVPSEAMFREAFLCLHDPNREGCHED
jgi:hypothetical protein